MKKRVLSAFLSLCMMLTMVPAALAVDDTEGSTTDTSNEDQSRTSDVASIGGSGYGTLQSAFETATSGQVIQLNTDVTLATGIDVTKTVTLDLNGHTIASSGLAFNVSEENVLFTIQDSGENRGSITSSNTNNLIQVSGGELVVDGGELSNDWYVIYVSQAGKATVKDGVLTSQVASVLSTNGSSIDNENYSGNAVMNVEGGTLTSTGDVTIYVPAGTLNVSGGNIRGATAIYSKSGTTTITAGTITSESTNVGFQHSGSGCNATGDAMVVEACGYPNGEPIVRISGGTFTSTNGSAVAYYQYENNEAKEISITGGTFSSDVSNYVATNYECVKDSTSNTYSVKKIEDKLVVDTDTTEDGKVSGTLEGTFAGDSTDDSGEGVTADDNSVNVDLTTTPSSSNTTSATLSITAETAKSLAEGDATLTVQSDVGTVELPQSAVGKMKDVASDVTVSITKNNDNTDDKIKASYTVEVKADGKNLLPESAADNGTIVITVDKPAETDNTSLQAWYAVENNGSMVYVKELDMQNTDDNKVAISIDHLSTIVLTDGTPSAKAVATVTAADGNKTYYANFDDALSAVTTNGGTVDLLDNVSMTAGMTISGAVTINGNGKTITGKAADASVNFKVESGTFTISNVTLDGFGSNAATDSGIAVIKVESGKENVEVNATNVNITNFCRSAYDIRSGEFTITGGKIDSGVGPNDGDSNTRITKGIMAGYGSGTVIGMISNLVIINSASNYSDWSAGGIEIYKNAEVKISKCDISGVENGISVDNYYSVGGGSATGAVVSVENTTVSATNDAIRVYGSGGSANNETASVSVNGGSYTGDIAIINGSDSTDKDGETIGIDNATINGDIDNANGSIGIINSTVKMNSENPTDVVFVNCKDGAGNAITNATVGAGKVAMVNGVQYDTLQAAVEAAPNGATVALLADVTLSGSGKGDTQGLLTINKSITLDGNGKTITATDVTADADDKGPSMINIEGGANVTVRDLTIDGKEVGENPTDNTKHGLNVYGDTTSVTVENVTIKNGNGYGIVVNGAQATINGLTTSANGWGGINVDSKSGAASLIVKDADISEENSIKFEKSTGATSSPKGKIEGGTFQYIVNDIGGDELELTISGGKFATGTYDGAIDVGDYLAPGLSIDGDGSVYRPSGSTGSGGGGGSTGYAVSVSGGINNGSVTVSPKNAAKGATVTITVTPDAGYELDTLTVKDASGNAIDLTRKSDTTYTFEMPSGRVTIDATFAETSTTPSNPFADVAANAYYADAVLWAVENDITDGTSATTFSPNASCTRAQMVTFLWRAAGSPEPQSAENPFADVASNAYYADAVLWAVEQGITTGTSETTFSPNATVTRGQTVTFLYRDAGSPAASAAGTFTDVAADAYYAAAVQWAVSEGVTDGMTSTTFQPDGNCTRAQIVTFLYRYLVA